MWGLGPGISLAARLVQLCQATSRSAPACPRLALLISTTKPFAGVSQIQNRFRDMAEGRTPAPEKVPCVQSSVFKVQFLGPLRSVQSSVLKVFFFSSGIVCV